MLEKKKKKKRKKSKLGENESLVYQAPMNEVKSQPVSDPNKRSTLLDPEVIEKIDQIYLQVRQKSKSKEAVVEKDLPVEKKKPESAFDETKADRRRMAKGLPSRENSITVKELGYEYGINAKDLRRMIRKSSIVRPGGRWEWKLDSKGLRKIKRLIEKSGRATKKPEMKALLSD